MEKKTKIIIAIVVAAVIIGLLVYFMNKKKKEEAAKKLAVKPGSKKALATEGETPIKKATSITKMKGLPKFMTERPNSGLSDSNTPVGYVKEQLQ